MGHDLTKRKPSAWNAFQYEQAEARKRGTRAHPDPVPRCINVVLIVLLDDNKENEREEEEDADGSDENEDDAGRAAPLQLAHRVKKLSSKQRPYTAAPERHSWIIKLERSKRNNSSRLCW